MSEPVTISIVVPNFNGAATVGATLQSLVDQAYPKLEIIVVDGGSTDDSVPVIKRYEPHLAWWVSEKDRGQTHAINKGLAHCTGAVVNWLCSDDQLLPQALWTVANRFEETPEIEVLGGAAEFVDERTAPTTAQICQPLADCLDNLPLLCPIQQPSCFFRRRLLRRTPPLDESYRYAMDFELWCYFCSQQARWRITTDVLSRFVFSGTNKSSAHPDAFLAENARVFAAYGTDWRLRWHRWLRQPLNRWAARHPGRMGQGASCLRQAMTVLLASYYGMSAVRLRVQQGAAKPLPTASLDGPTTRV